MAGLCTPGDIPPAGLDWAAHGGMSSCDWSAWAEREVSAGLLAPSPGPWPGIWEILETPGWLVTGYDMCAHACHVKSVTCPTDLHGLEVG